MSKRGFITPDEFEVANAFKSLADILRPRPLADPKKAINCLPFKGRWTDYFNTNQETAV